MEEKNGDSDVLPIKDTLDLLIECEHDVSFPPSKQSLDAKEKDTFYHPPFPDSPARQYPFTLDPFQKMSVACLERKESVLVSAHTSAGKTVVAEYAIAMALRDNQRVIYTSPIKALSNQKYRELYEEFFDVGLMTGDVTINPTASCLVMTTEILRSMLYRGSEIMREVFWVIFDEIHYMRDKDRGVVWEETIILLPDKVRYVFLSATIPNAKEFSDWISTIHQQVCHVVYTNYRPTPLQHYIFPSGGDGLFLVVDDKSKFREDNFQKAIASLAVKAAPQRRASGGRQNFKQQQSKTPNDCLKIVTVLMERNYSPVIVFSFSKRDCETYALQMAKLDFNDEDSKKLVGSVFENAIDSLSDDDQKLPQVEHILPLLKRGIGIHHSGLLPILKEVIEILFQEGLIKILFATETFALGLNMPAKTVVFTNIEKFDGIQKRMISGGEYIQMSGRAGRRGLDDRGIVVLMLNSKIEPVVVKTILKGHADALNSEFHLGYNMLLNLMRVEGVDPEFIIKKSFHQYQHSCALPSYKERLTEIDREIAAISFEDEGVLSEYYQLNVQKKKLTQLLKDIMYQPMHILPFLQPGRLVKVKDQDTDWGWGVLLNFQKRNDSVDSAKQALTMGSGVHYILDVAIRVTKETKEGGGATKIPFDTRKGHTQKEMEVITMPVLLPLLDGVSSVRVYLPKDVRLRENRKYLGKNVSEAEERFPDGIPLLDPIDDLGITDDTFKKVVRKLEAIEDRLSHENFALATIKEDFGLYNKKMQLELEKKELRKLVKLSQGIILKDKLKCMKRVLRRLGFTDKENIITLKGRVACEINASDELLITELVFNGVLNTLTPECIAALISCFVFQEKSDSTQRLKDELKMPLRILRENARKVATVSKECKIEIDVEAYVEKFQPSMMDVVHSWCDGAKFADICKMTNIFEGSIIRCMRRLEELLRQLTAAAKAIGNAELEVKCAEAISKIKRDIVFAVSLYL